MILIVLSTLIGVFYFISVDLARREAELACVKSDSSDPSDLGAVVYCIRDTAQGESILADALEEAEIRRSRIPSGALVRSWEAIGRKASRPISQGQLVNIDDLCVAAESTYVRSVKEIRKGSTIQANSVEEVTSDGNEVPSGAFFALKQVVGKTSTKSISAKRFLVQADVEP